jgi:hypothetical protein
MITYYEPPPRNPKTLIRVHSGTVQQSEGLIISYDNPADAPQNSAPPARVTAPPACLSEPQSLARTEGTPSASAKPQPRTFSAEDREHLKRELRISLPSLSDAELERAMALDPTFTMKGTVKTTWHQWFEGFKIRAAKSPSTAQALQNSLRD